MAPSSESLSSTHSKSSSWASPSWFPAAPFGCAPVLAFFLLKVWYGLHPLSSGSLNMRVGMRFTGGVSSLHPSCAMVVLLPGQITRICSSRHLAVPDIV